MALTSPRPKLRASVRPNSPDWGGQVLQVGSWPTVCVRTRRPCAKVYTAVRCQPTRVSAVAAKMSGWRRSAHTAERATVLRTSFAAIWVLRRRRPITFGALESSSGGPPAGVSTFQSRHRGPPVVRPAGLVRARHYVHASTSACASARSKASTNAITTMTVSDGCCSDTAALRPPR